MESRSRRFKVSYDQVLIFDLQLRLWCLIVSVSFIDYLNVHLSYYANFEYDCFVFVDCDHLFNSVIRLK